MISLYVLSVVKFSMNRALVKDSLYPELSSLPIVSSSRTEALAKTVSMTDKIFRQLDAAGEDSNHTSLVRISLVKFMSFFIELKSLKQRDNERHRNRIKKYTFSLLLPSEV